MTLITLQRAAPVTPGATVCQLCDEPIAGTLQDRLLVGQPGTQQQVIVSCQTCGETLRRLVELVGTEVTVVMQD
jgi:RNase P subunit RPR2